jgi:hypothetical protein
MGDVRRTKPLCGAASALAASLFVLVAACSSGSRDPGAALGASCDPQASAACAPSSNPCAQTLCDPRSRTCRADPVTSPSCAPGGTDGGSATRYPTSVDGGVGDPCTSTAQCSAGLSCIDGVCFD